MIPCPSTTGVGTDICRRAQCAARDLLSHIPPALAGVVPLDGWFNLNMTIFMEKHGDIMVTNQQTYSFTKEISMLLWNYQQPTVKRG